MKFELVVTSKKRKKKWRKEKRNWSPAAWGVCLHTRSCQTRKRIFFCLLLDLETKKSRAGPVAISFYTLIHNLYHLFGSRAPWDGDNLSMRSPSALKQQLVPHSSTIEISSSYFKSQLLGVVCLLLFVSRPFSHKKSITENDNVNTTGLQLQKMCIIRTDQASGPHVDF